MHSEHEGFASNKAGDKGEEKIVRGYDSLNPALFRLLSGSQNRYSQVRQEVETNRNGRFRAAYYLAVVGCFGSLVGWYYDAMLECLACHISDAKFGPALVWFIIAGIFVRAFNKVVYKD